MQTEVGQNHSDSSDLARKAERFRSLHVRGNPLVLFNVWDPGSAKVVAQAGAQALATGSWAVAAALGFSDGERTPLTLAIDNLARIARGTTLPVTVDLESGYGSTAEGVGKTIELAVGAGAIGCNLEDSQPVTGELRTAAEQAQRIQQARRSADGLVLGFFINARTDVFFQGPPEEHEERKLAEVIERARHYADAGADGLFVPGLADLRLIERLTKAVALPVNIMVGGASPARRALAERGVARISHGGAPYLVTMTALQQAAHEASAAE
jgi:2-methylisocitrate lyase-like PEP mutase family enzyme